MSSNTGNSMDWLDAEFGVGPAPKPATNHAEPAPAADDDLAEAWLREMAPTKLDASKGAVDAMASAALEVTGPGALVHEEAGAPRAVAPATPVLQREVKEGASDDVLPLREPSVGAMTPETSVLPVMPFVHLTEPGPMFVEPVQDPETAETGALLGLATAQRDIAPTQVPVENTPPARKASTNLGAIPKPVLWGGLAVLGLVSAGGMYMRVRSTSTPPSAGVSAPAPVPAPATTVEAKATSAPAPPPPQAASAASVPVVSVPSVPAPVVAPPAPTPPVAPSKATPEVAAKPAANTSIPSRHSAKAPAQDESLKQYEKNGLGALEQFQRTHH